MSAEQNEIDGKREESDLLQRKLPQTYAFRDQARDVAVTYFNQQFEDLTKAERVAVVDVAKEMHPDLYGSMMEEIGKLDL